MTDEDDLPDVLPDDEPSDEEIIAKAMVAAREAYEKTMEDAHVDCSYYPINMEVLFLDDNFTYVVRKLKMQNWVPPNDKDDDI